MIRWALVMVGVALTATYVRSAAGQPPPDRRTVWSGVYTTLQAQRGEQGFQDHCEACHGADLRGNEGPALIGPAFLRNWTGLTLRELFHHIRVAMPEEAVSSVSDADKLDILAFIFQQNGFPAGNETLSLNARELGAIAFEGREGPEPPPTGATVIAVGCLTRSADGSWNLIRASEPHRTTLEAVRDGDLNEAADTPLGNVSIRLIGLPSVEVREGQKVVLVGLMVRTATTEAINVLELSRLADGCS